MCNLIIFVQFFIIRCSYFILYLQWYQSAKVSTPVNETPLNIHVYNIKLNVDVTEANAIMTQFFSSTHVFWLVDK